MMHARQVARRCYRDATSTPGQHLREYSCVMRTHLIASLKILCHLAGTWRSPTPATNIGRWFRRHSAQPFRWPTARCPDAANAVLDRCHGKPRQGLENEWRGGAIQIVYLDAVRNTGEGSRRGPVRLEVPGEAVTTLTCHWVFPAR